MTGCILGDFIGEIDRLFYAALAIQAGTQMAADKSKEAGRRQLIV
jgi:hypothetical protein